MLLTYIRSFPIHNSIPDAPSDRFGDAERFKDLQGLSGKLSDENRSGLDEGIQEIIVGKFELANILFQASYCVIGSIFNEISSLRLSILLLKSDLETSKVLTSSANT